MTTTTTTPKDTAPAAGQRSTNVSVTADPRADRSIWTASRVIALVFTVLEVLLLVRFAMKLLGANAQQTFVSAIYGITEPLVSPFRGIFAQPAGTPVVEVATIVSVIFFVLLGALIVAIVRAVTGSRGEPTA